MFSKLNKKFMNNKSKTLTLIAAIFMVSAIVIVNNPKVVYADEDIITCAAGEYYDDQGKCSTCPAGYYCPGGKFYRGGGEDGINQCPLGTTTEAGATSESECTRGVICAAGEYYSGQGKCSTCPAGYYCPGGKFDPSNGKREDGIYACPSGYDAMTGISSLSDCKSEASVEVCQNPDILKVIYFFLLIVDIIKIIIPIALIILGLIDFSKAMISSDESAQKKSGKLFLKRLLYAALVFIVPWLIEVIMVTLGNVLGEPGTTNFTDCIENANGDKIEFLENKKQTEEDVEDGKDFCYICNNAGNEEYVWGADVINNMGMCTKQENITNKTNCLVNNNEEGCYACGGSQGIRYNWGIYATGEQGGSCAFVSLYKDKKSCLEQNGNGKCYECFETGALEWSVGTPSRSCNGGWRPQEHLDKNSCK